MKYLFFSITCFFLCVSCKKSLANFSEPQPAHSKDLTSFPKKFIGKYHNAATNIDLIIEAQTVLLENHFTDTLNQANLSELQKETQWITTPINDSLFSITYTIIDTLFYTKNNDILRKMKGRYFLNTSNDKGNWEVKQLVCKNNLVAISSINNEASLLKLNEITETTTDTITPKTYTLSKKQFKDFIKQNGFSESDLFVRVE